MPNQPHDASDTAREAKQTVSAAARSNDRDARARLEQLCVDTIRFLAVDAVEQANSGHPGTPMGMADMAFVLWTEFLRHDPRDPQWRNRDRFILSAGHASMLLYSLLHLTGYEEMTIDELRNFRQWDSKTAGHPEYGHAAGIEVTTGPLGQGFANGVGMGLAAKMMAARFNDEDFSPVDHYIYAFCSDGDLMEGISAEAASLAGHLGLGNLIYLYDDNRITIEGETRLAFSEEVRKRFDASGWHVQTIDGHDRDAIRRAIRKAQKVTDRPSLIVCRTIIGWGAPNLHGTAEAHGAPLGKDEVRATKDALGWPQEPLFHVPDEVREEFQRRTRRLARSSRRWEKSLEEWRGRDTARGELWDRFWSRDLPSSAVDEMVEAGRSEKAAATRSLSGQVLQKLAVHAPFLVGGSADLAPSTNTILKGEGNIARPEEEGPAPPLEIFRGRNLHFGVREHAMAAMVNGMTLYGSWRAYAATFLIFSDYMRPSVRLSALMGIPSIFVFTHDSIFLGEDGPTHQPVEHLFALRLIPRLRVLRPADGVEVAMAWAAAVRSSDAPTAIVLTRQKLEPIERPDGFDHQKVLRGAYVLDGWEEGDLTLVASGSELPLAIEVAKSLRERGESPRVVSAFSLDMFADQSVSYQDSVLGADRGSIVALEAGASDGWYRWVDRDALVIGIDRFGASAPGGVLAEKFGFTAESVLSKIGQWRAERLKS